jgi:Flp pilus assembly protein TadD
MSNLSSMMLRVERSILYAVLILFPIIILPISPNLFIVPKVIVLATLVTLLLLVFSARTIISGKLEFHRGKFDIPVILIVASYIASTLIATPNKMEAFLLPGTTTIIVAAGILYFLLNQHKEHKGETLALVVFVSGAIYSAISLLSALGIFNSLTALSGFVPVAKASAEGGYISGIIFLGSIAALLPWAMTHFKSGINKTIAIVASGIIGVGFVLSIVQVIPGRAFEQKLPGYITSWSIAIDAIKNTPLTGVGPGNYTSAFSRYKPYAFNSTDVWNVRYATGTNYYFTLLTENGLLGLAAYLVLMLFVYRHATLGNEETNKRLQSLPVVVTLLAFLIFPHTLVLLVGLFVFLSIATDTKKSTVTLVAQSDNQDLTVGTAMQRVPALVLTLPIIGFAVWILYKGMPIVRAEYTYTQALSALSQNKAKDTYDMLQETVRLNPYVDRYHITGAQVNLLLANALVQSAKDTEITEQNRKNISTLIQQSIQSAKNAVALNPYRSGNWELLGGIYRSIMGVATGSDQFAIQSYRQAIVLDQFNPIPRIQLGGIYYANKDYENAIEVFKNATTAKPDYPNARYNLAFAYSQKQDFDMAIAEMSRVVTLVTPGTKDHDAATRALEQFKSQKQANAENTPALTSPDTTTEVLNPPVDLPVEAAPPEAPILETAPNGDVPATETTITPILSPTVTPTP